MKLRAWLGLSTLLVSSASLIGTGCTRHVPGSVWGDHSGENGKLVLNSSDGQLHGLKGALQTEGAAGASDERMITILATNDIHGGVEEKTLKDGSRVGGMSTLAGAVKAIRQGMADQLGDKGGVLLVDAGDQFQGTLISNYSEGQLVFQTMNAIGYDAVITGNHDYDFGPQGWLDDQVNPANADKNPRGALMKLKQMAKFPIISANTYFKDSIVTTTGKKLKVDGVGCKISSSDPIDWAKAKRPEFLTPYLVKEVAGVRVALVGIDNPGTPLITTASNVSDLCFRDEAESFREIRAELEGKADVFVMVMHNGDTNSEFAATNVAKALTADKPLVDAIVAGHTHFYNNAVVGGVPIIQSYANGEDFGRIDLVWDVKAKKLVASKMRHFAGIQLSVEKCTKGSETFCKMDSGRVTYEGVAVEKSAAIDQLIAVAKKELAQVAERKLGEAEAVVGIDRISESPLADALTDTLRTVAKVDISFMNTGGIRAPIAKGAFTYEDFYRVLPFNNRALVIGPMKESKILSMLEKSVKTCGKYGALMQSGLKVEFSRDCKAVTDGSGIDRNAKLQKVTTLGGELIFDRSVADTAAKPDREFMVATLDFLANGGDGFDEFSGVPVRSDLGIAREIMVDYFLMSPARLSEVVDGRWKEITAP